MTKWHTQLITPNDGTCPDCGMALDLYCKPVNVYFLKCCACKHEFSPEYYQGFLDAQKRAAELPDAPSIRAAERSY